MTSAKARIERLRFENLTFQYEGQDPVFTNVDFEFPLNETVWVRAEHGRGRSTLLQILAGLQIPTGGAYFINDENVTEMSFEEFLPYRLQIGYGFDSGGLIHNRTVFENIVLPLHYHKTVTAAEATERVHEYLNVFGLMKYRDLRPSFISGGTRKLACLIRAMVLHPQMLLLDDPTVGVAQETALKYFDLLNNLRSQGILNHVFVSSFDPKFMSLIDHVEVFIDGGILHSTPHETEKKVVAL